MKVLHLIAGELSEGAARGAICLHEGLLKKGIDSKVLNHSSTTSSQPEIYKNLKSAKAAILNQLNLQLESKVLDIVYKNRENVIFSTGILGAGISDDPLYQWADILHLHWINYAFLKLSDLKAIKKPIVWTMRDMWPFTGGCHIAEVYGCTRYRESCGNCPQLRSNHRFDISKLILKRKLGHYPKNIHVVGISQWISNRAGSSAVFKNNPVTTIYNSINTTDFSPVNKTMARSILNLPQDKKILLVGAHSFNVFYKGFDKFIESIRYLPVDKVHILVIGQANISSLENTGVPITYFGFANDLTTMRLLYSGADVFVSPSRIDSFGKMLAEAMACKTPVVCFDATGPGEIVTHKVNGYKATPFDPEDLANGICWVLEHERYESLCENARQRVVQVFDISLITDQYIDLYKKLL